MDKPIKMEHSPDFGQGHCGSPQLRPASAGPSFTLTSTSSTTTSQKANTQAGLPRAMPCWPEISHAEQLKQMAANQHQPNSLLHHLHQTPPAGLTSWTPTMSTYSSTSTFPQDKVSSSPTLSQQRVSSQSKGINNCLFKSNGHSGSHHLDMKVLSTKPTLHFSPKAQHSASQPISVMGSSVNKTSAQQQQSPSTGQSLHFPNQPTPGSLCLQPKPVPPGLPFKVSQQRQVRTLLHIPSNMQTGEILCKSLENLTLVVLVSLWLDFLQYNIIQYQRSKYEKNTIIYYFMFITKSMLYLITHDTNSCGKKFINRLCRLLCLNDSQEDHRRRNCHWVIRSQWDKHSHLWAI